MPIHEAYVTTAPGVKNQSPMAQFRESRVEEIKNPSKSPFTKGDFLFPPFSKGGKGGFLDKRESEFK